MIKYSRILVLALFWCVNCLFGAAAQTDITLTSSQADALRESLVKFETAMEVGDWNTVTTLMPQPVLLDLERQAGVTRDELIASIAQLMEQAFEVVTLEQFGFAKDEFQAEQLDGGTIFVRVPTYIVMVINDVNRMQVESETLAILDGATWSFARIQEPQQLALLTNSYPQFSEVTFGQAKITMLPAESGDINEQ